MISSKKHFRVLCLLLIMVISITSASILAQDAEVTPIVIGFTSDASGQ